MYNSSFIIDELERKESSDAPTVILTMAIVALIYLQILLN